MIGLPSPHYVWLESGLLMPASVSWRSRGGESRLQSGGSPSVVMRKETAIRYSRVGLVIAAFALVAAIIAQPLRHR